MERYRDHSGKTYGRLFVVRFLRRQRNGTVWLCRCSCGTEREVVAGNFAKTQSCGCLKKELAGKPQITHGRNRTKEHLAWKNMKASPYVEGCDRWKNSFADFLSDMGYAGQGYRLERLDKTKGFEPDNCRWAAPVAEATKRRAWRQPVLIRDNMACRSCGSASDEVHHIDGHGEDLRGANNSPENLIILCPSCHQSLENLLRRGASSGVIGALLERRYP